MFPSGCLRPGTALILVLCAGGLRAQPAENARTVNLISPSQGQIPNDTGSDGLTRLTIVKSKELGGDALNVVFAPGDSFGDRVSRVRDWTPFARLRFQILNPGPSPVKLYFNINHRRTINYQTRTVVQLTLPPGRSTHDLLISELRNVNGSVPDLANVLKWYFHADEGQSPTLMFSDLLLETPGAARREETPAGTAVAPATGRFRVRGTIGNSPVDLTVEPLDTPPAGASGPARAALGTRPHGDPARLARLKAARMPKIDRVIAFDTPEADAVLAALEVFPPDNPWNLVVSDWPLHPHSQALVNSIGSDKVLRVNEDMAFVIVPPDQPRVDVRMMAYPDESDSGPFPIPDSLPIEGWPKAYARQERKWTLAEVQRRPAEYEGDRHAIVLDPTAGRLYEFFVMGRIGTQWAADQASVFNLRSNALRPAGWTSADAAGLPIFPAVIRHDELQRGEIEHAMRFTIRRSRKAYVHPATHHAGHSDDESLPRMGERFRLRQDFDISRFSPTVQTILRGLKKYGMFVADNGLEWSLSMTPDPRIPDIHEELRRVKGSDFEVIVPPAE